MSTDITSRLGRLTSLEQRQNAYRAIVPEALLDLSEFCRANETCFHENERVNLILEGRRQVWLRIQEHIHLTTAQLMALYQGRAFQLEK